MSKIKWADKYHPKVVTKYSMTTPKNIFFGKLLVIFNHFIQIELLLYQHQILNDFYIKKLKTWKDTEKL